MNHESVEEAADLLLTNNNQYITEQNFEFDDFEKTFIEDPLLKHFNSFIASIMKENAEI